MIKDHCVSLWKSHNEVTYLYNLRQVNKKSQNFIFSNMSHTIKYNICCTADIPVATYIEFRNKHTCEYMSNVFDNQNFMIKKFCRSFS
jgi:hypothetical protein